MERVPHGQQTLLRASCWYPPAIQRPGPYQRNVCGSGFVVCAGAAALLIQNKYKHLSYNCFWKFVTRISPITPGHGRTISWQRVERPRARFW